jgi:hypothetical protein
VRVQVSKTRLVVRNLPRTCEEVALKNMFYAAAQQAAGAGHGPVRIVQAKIERERERLDANGQGRSRVRTFLLAFGCPMG